MRLARTMAGVAVLAAAGVVGGCAGHGQGMPGMQGMHGMHAMHGGAYAAGENCPMHAEMQQKMAAAKTPEERQALMAEHHKSMGMGMGSGDGMQCPMMQPATK